MSQNCCDAPKEVGVTKLPNFTKVFRIRSDYTFGPGVRDVEVIAPEPPEEGEDPTEPPIVTLPRKPTIGYTVTVAALGGPARVVGGCFPICGVSDLEEAEEEEEDDCGCKDKCNDCDDENTAELLVPQCTLATFRFTSECTWVYSLSATAGQSQGQGEIIVPNIAAVEALDVDELPAGTYARPLTIDQPFEYDPDSTETVNGISVLSTSSGSGRWLRQLRPVRQWTKQTTWFVDSAAGDDENDGATSATPLATLQELTRRLQQVTFANYTVNLLADVPATDLFDLNPSFDGEGSTTALQANFTLRGQATVAASGAIAAATGTTPATNTQAEITAAFSLVPHIGRLVRLTSGALSGYTAWILGILGGNSSRVSNWFDPSTNAVAAVGAAPAPGDTFEIVTLTEINASIRYPNMPSRLVVFWNLVRFTPTGQLVIEDANTNFINVDVNTNTLIFAPGVGQQARGPRDNSFWVCAGCLIRPANNRNMLVFDLRTRLIASAALDTDIEVINTGRLELINHLHQGGTIKAGRVFAGFTGDTSPTGNPGIGIFAGNFGLGIFDSPGDGLELSRCSETTLDGPLYGDGNASVGAEVVEGATLMIRTTVVPTITGTTAEVRLNLAGTAIPPLVAGGAVPAAAPLTTWAQWAAAPFSRNVMSYTNGAKIIEVLAGT